jgi:DNA-binding transcriptional LysR family regulator
MHIRNLKVFCDVVARHSFSRAAEDNGMTQSGASQAVQQLEDYLQVQLLDRSKRPFVITNEGEVFYSGCCKLVRQFDNLTEEVRSLGQEISGRVTVAAIYSVGLSYLPELQPLLKLRFPKAEFRFQFCHPDDVYRAVEQGSVDFGLVSYPQQSKTIAATHWLDEPMVLAAPAGHELTRRARVTPEDLGLESLIAFAPNLRIRHEIDRYLRTIGITMPIAAEFDNVDSLKHALGLHNAVSFLPRPTIAEELENGTLVAVTCDWLDLQRPLGIILRRDTALGRTARAFYELLIQRNEAEVANVASRSSSGSSIALGDSQVACASEAAVTAEIEQAVANGSATGNGAEASTARTSRLEPTLAAASAVGSSAVSSSNASTATARASTASKKASRRATNVNKKR